MNRKNDFKSLTLRVDTLERLLAEGRRITHLPAVSATSALEAVLGELERLRVSRSAELPPKKVATK